MSDILRGDRVVIGVGPKVWLVESAGRIGRRPPHARLRDQDWQRDRTAYFAGICWKKLREIQALAEQIVAGDDAP